MLLGSLMAFIQLGVLRVALRDITLGRDGGVELSRDVLEAVRLEAALTGEYEDVVLLRYALEEPFDLLRRELAVRTNGDKHPWSLYAIGDGIDALGAINDVRVRRLLSGR